MKQNDLEIYCNLFMTKISVNISLNSTNDVNIGR